PQVSNWWPSSCCQTTRPMRHCKLTVTSMTPKGRGMMGLEVLNRGGQLWPSSCW
ncbi:unnamed protein product, partial [Staurois parvus]